jgi:hypothetical protein
MKKVQLYILLVLLGGTVYLSQALAAESIYRWVDEDGNVHFGNRAPQGVEAVQINVKPHTVPLVQSGANTLTNLGNPKVVAEAAVDGEEPLSVPEQLRQNRAERRREQAEKDRIKAVNCEVMRNQKRQVEPSTRVLVDDGNGGVRRLTDQERQDLLTEANNYLSENCD